MMPTADVLVVGGGIAGVSIAADLASDHRVILAETERVLAHHTTGRSAAIFIESYGHPLVRELSRASRSLLMHPPMDLVDGPLCQPRAMMFVATESQRASFDALVVAQPQLQELDRAGIVDLVPALAGGDSARGACDFEALDIDVSGLHQLFVRQLRNRGGEINLSSPVRALAPNGTDQGWRATLGDATVEVGVVINAAGAWGDVVAAMAGVAPVGLTPRRRTIFTTPWKPGSQNTHGGSAEFDKLETGRAETSRAETSSSVPVGGWPLVVDVDEQFYFRNEGQDLLLGSAADETPSEPCDAKAEEIDVALGIARINEATDLDIRSVTSAWAGLRTFSPDRAPVIGFDDQAPGFFWLVGQGGTGIQTSPGAAALAGRVVRGDQEPGAFGVSRLREWL